MAVYRKEHVKEYLDRLALYYEELRRAVEGVPANDNLAHHYNCETNQFSREYVDINMTNVVRHIGHFKVEVESLKELKNITAKPNHR